MAEAQETGAISGTVTARESGQPLEGAQVFLPGMDIGTITGQDGQYRLTQVPPGTQTVRVRHVGYGNATQQVTVEAGQTVTGVDFTLTTSAIDMEELVVTGAGGETERRRLGQSLSSVQSQDLETAPVSDVSQLLKGRIPGLTGLGQATSGSGSLLRLRGVVSLTGDNRPVIYIDGVRMRNDFDRTASVMTDQLSQLNPANIERIEVIKGAAAATLYGSQAAGGVIQIFTKQGTSGGPYYNFHLKQQALSTDLGKFPHNYGYNPSTGEVLTNKPAAIFIRTGYNHEYNLSVRGGNPDARYYVTGGFKGETGTLPDNSVDDGSLTASVDVTPGNLQAGVDVDLSRRTLAAPWPWWGLPAEFLLANPANETERRPFGESDFTVAGVLAEENVNTSDNIRVNGNLQYAWTENISSSLTVGWHQVSERQKRFRPEDAGPLDFRGVRSLTNNESYSRTVDLKTRWETPLSESFSSDLVLGAQGFWEGASGFTTSVLDFPSPELETLTAGSTIGEISEDFSEVINAGLFVQEQLGYNDLLFLTTGVRIDGNSAFGEDLAFQAYPKAGLSWVVSEQEFWNPDFIEQLRVRGAFGTSGLHPDPFVHEQTWNPTSAAGNQPVAVPGNVGNPDLQPERSREWEAGFEMGLWDGRLGIDFNFWDQTTTNALLPVPVAPSGGFLGSQVRNVGETSSRGIEASVNATILEVDEGVGWSLTTNFTTSDSKIVDLGPIEPFRPSGTHRRNRVLFREGYSTGALFARVQNPDDPYETAVPIEEVTSLGEIQPNILKASDGTDSLVYLGDAHPDWTISLDNRFQLGNDFTLRALFTGEGGFLISNATQPIRESLHNTEVAARTKQVIKDPNSSVEQRREWIDRFGRKHWSVQSSWMSDGDYLRLSELALTYEVPGELFGATTRVTLSGGDLHTFTGYDGVMSPGAGWATAGPTQFSTNVDYFAPPLPRRVGVDIRLNW